jgi:hypothetical protein
VKVGDAKTYLILDKVEGSILNEHKLLRVLNMQKDAEGVEAVGKDDPRAELRASAEANAAARDRLSEMQAQGVSASQC